jgi:crotonobetainyl-CoA:carnitine CoA-transferase CaiB-like acyl-CoA transferase
MSGPLEGIRILEVGHILAAPFGTMLLADLGADVIKLEPDSGDLSRTVGSPRVGGYSAYFTSINRGKRSVRIELATPEGQEQLAALVRTADALPSASTVSTTSRSRSTTRRSSRLPSPGSASRVRPPTGPPSTTSCRR